MEGGVRPNGGGVGREVHTEDRGGEYVRHGGAASEYLAREGRGYGLGAQERDAEQRQAEIRETQNRKARKRGRRGGRGRRGRKSQNHVTHNCEAQGCKTQKCKDQEDVALVCVMVKRLVLAPEAQQCPRTMEEKTPRRSNDGVICVTVPVITKDKRSPAANKAPPNADEAKIQCPVCRDSLRVPTSTFCGHIFCEECIKTAIRTMGRCPVCNKQMRDNMMHRLFL